MRMMKRTYALPENVVRPFEEAVERGQRSALLAGLLRFWLAEQRRKALRAEILEGCQEMAEEFLELEKSFRPLEEEAGRGL